MLTLEGNLIGRPVPRHVLPVLAEQRERLLLIALTSAAILPNELCNIGIPGPKCRVYRRVTIAVFNVSSCSSLQ
jgi:hypothetical protein